MRSSYWLKIGQVLFNSKQFLSFPSWVCRYLWPSKLCSLVSWLGGLHYTKVVQWHRSGLLPCKYCLFQWCCDTQFNQATLHLMNKQQPNHDSIQIYPFPITATQWLYCHRTKGRLIKTRGEKARMDGQSAYFLSKPTTGQVSTSWPFLLLVSRAVVSTEMKSAPYPIPSC